MGVQIMLLTLNGEAFIEAQLDCLFEQNFPLFDILIRDNISMSGKVSRVVELL